MNKFYTAIIAVISTVLIFSVGCCKKPSDPTVIRVAASITPHAEILEQAKPIMAEKGFTLIIQAFEDYVQPNLVVESGEFDANYMEHVPYMNSINKEKNLHLVNAGGIHY